jgi:hypothetical protein
LQGNYEVAKALGRALSGGIPGRHGLGNGITFRERNWIRLLDGKSETIAFLLLVIAACPHASPHYDLETIHKDIRRAKIEGGMVLEVKVLKVDSLRTIKRFSTGKPYFVESRDSAEGTFRTERTQYRAEFKVIGNIAGSHHPKDIPLVATDSRPDANLTWKRAWPAEKRSDRYFVVVLEKGARIRAVYEAKRMLDKNDDFEKARISESWAEIDEILQDSRYEDFVNRKDLLEMLRASDRR